MGSKSRECTVCKHYGLETSQPENLEQTKLFDDSDKVVTVLLCRKHSVDLFKMGQKKFLLDHYQILNEVINSDEPKFIELLEKTYRTNMDRIF